jgi:hypothetical protein
MSLARSFQYAGCPSLVVSLWPVDDLATSDLMTYYYSHLQKGLPKDRALQMAKLDFLENADPATSHPFYWAGFILIGDTSPLHFKSGIEWRWWWTVTACFVILLLGWRFLVWKRNSLQQ